jgi:formimidoylglutamate deiminase
MHVTVFEPHAVYAQGRLTEGARLAVGPDGRVLEAAPEDAVVVKLPGRLLMPGLVNAHSHAFQRVLRGRTEFLAPGREADDFWSWRELMYRAANALDPDSLYLVSRQAFLEMALAGITTVGEFHYVHHEPSGTPYSDPQLLAHQVIRAARDVGLRIVLLRVLYARAGYQVPENPLQRRFLDPDVDTALSRVEALRSSAEVDPLVTVGLAPHSVRAVPRDWLTAVRTGFTRGVIHMHVAEQPGEVKACLAEYGRRPVQLVDDVGLLGPRFTGVHAVHLSDDEVLAFGARDATVCACPSTERNLGDGVVPADALLAGGATLALGSDSQAHIDLLEDARQLEGHLRLVRLKRNVLDPRRGEVSGLGARLLDVATAGGARSLGLDLGRLAPGTPADFCTLDLRHPSVVGAPLEAVLSAVVLGAQRAAVRDVAVQGRFIVRDGHHDLAEATLASYEGVMRRLAR